MSNKHKKTKGLGRGLSALMADVGVTGAETKAQNSDVERLLPVDLLEPNPDQPRRLFEETDLAELAASISAKGIIQPLIVRPSPRRSEAFEIVAGERRWRAAQIAQLHSVPVIVRTLEDTEVLEIAIIENIQRADLNAIEEALGYRQLIDRFGHTQEQLASSLGKSRSHIANLMRLLQLPGSVQDLVVNGRLSAGHARALITATDPEVLARQVVSRDLSVRETEKLAKVSQASGGNSGRGRRKTEKDADTRALEADLAANLGMSVQIAHGAAGDGGQLTVRYKDLDQLDLLCQALSAANRSEF